MVNHCIDAVERDTLKPRKKKENYVQEVGVHIRSGGVVCCAACQAVWSVFAGDPPGPPRQQGNVTGGPSHETVRHIPWETVTLNIVTRHGFRDGIRW